MISIIKTLVQALASAARQAEDRETMVIDCIEQSVADLLACIDSDEKTTGALAYVEDELCDILPHQIKDYGVGFSATPGIPSDID